MSNIPALHAPSPSTQASGNVLPRSGLTFARFPMRHNLASDRAETTALAALCALRDGAPDGSPVTASAVEIAGLARCDTNHLRARVLKPWRTEPEQLVSVTEVSQRTKLYTVAGGPFIKFPAWVVTSTNVETSAIVVLLALCAGLSHADMTAPVERSLSQLAEAAKMSRRTVIAAVAELESAGAIEVERRKISGTPLSAPNHYRIMWQPESRVRAPRETESRVREPRESRVRAPGKQPRVARQSTGSNQIPRSTLQSATPAGTAGHCRGRGGEIPKQDRPSRQLLDRLDDRPRWSDCLGGHAAPSRGLDRRTRDALDAGWSIDWLADWLEHHAEAQPLTNAQQPIGLLVHRLGSLVESTEPISLQDYQATERTRNERAQAELEQRRQVFYAEVEAQDSQATDRDRLDAVATSPEVVRDALAEAREALRLARPDAALTDTQ